MYIFCLKFPASLRLVRPAGGHVPDKSWWGGHGRAHLHPVAMDLGTGQKCSPHYSKLRCPFHEQNAMFHWRFHVFFEILESPTRFLREMYFFVPITGNYSVVHIRFPSQLGVPVSDSETRIPNLVSLRFVTSLQKPVSYALQIL